MSRARSQASRPQASRELRNYRLGDRIGEDELATIYAATHQMLERPVQVHILRRTDWVTASRFNLAARLAARLSHPNLLPVIDAGHDDTFGDYLVTPTLDAQPLTTLLAEAEHGALDPVLALRLATQVAAALDYLHSEQVIHRDVQPANILVTSHSLAYLTNLSFAAGSETPDLSSVDEADYLTPYAAPEQRLDPAEATPALDVYGLGAVLYHMLAGEMPPLPPIELPSLKQHRADLEAADPVLRRMLAEQPATRYAHAGEALAALRRALRPLVDLATEDMQESRWEQVAEWRENPLETVLSTAFTSEMSDTDTEATPAPAASVPTEAQAGLATFRDYLGKNRTRADALHRGDTIRRLLNRWSRKGVFRRSNLGQIIQLEQIVSYTVYFYALRTQYETRGEPTEQRRPATEYDRNATLEPPSLWAVPVVDTPPFTPVKQQPVLVPDSTQVFPCPTCGGEGEVPCPTCEHTGLIERTRLVRAADGSTREEVLSQPCPDCHGYGKQKCATCAGNGNLAEELVFAWSRDAKLWENTDDVEGLPLLALQKRAEPVCTVSIDPYEGIWHSVAPLDELLRAAIAAVPNEHTRIIAAELRIRAVPVTEVDYLLNEHTHSLALIGHDNLVVGGWELMQPERIALAVLGSALLLALLVGVLALLV